MKVKLIFVAFRSSYLLLFFLKSASKYLFIQSKQYLTFRFFRLLTVTLQLEVH